MKQLLQRLDTGDTTITDVPVPAMRASHLLVESRVSLISAGTERSLVDFGRANLIDKARSQPDKVRQVLQKMRTDGVGPTLEAVRSKLEAPIALGYCQAGVVVETASNVTQFQPGDRVVTNASHAEYGRVPVTLAALIPEGVSFEAAAFTPVASIGLQGIRLVQPTLGETIVVYGLGLIGLLTVQLLRANGCRVIGIDTNDARLAMAQHFGAEPIDGRTGDVAAQVKALTRDVGADAVLLTLASKSDEPVLRAAEMTRKRGRLVLVGVTGLQLSRDAFYKKELSFAVSCSYGPGRYDPTYEEGAQDYPLPYVRWTEQRNFEAVLALMKSGQVDPLPLISHRFDFAAAADAYELISSGQPSLGVLLTYEDRGGEAPASASRTIDTGSVVRGGAAARGTVSVIGAGNFATRVLLPALAKAGARFDAIASSGGASGALAARKFKFARATTALDTIFEADASDTVFVLTRHDSHAALALRALEAGKHVFVEKPLALKEADLDAIERVARETGRLVMVGFNRRFAPQTREIQRHLRGRAGPLAIVATMNAGAIPRDHWTQDPKAGGGRIVGEACHMLDLVRALAGSPIRDVHVTVARDTAGNPIDDIAHLAVAFEDGSTAVVNYLSNGSRAYPKERIECFFDGKTAVIDNWRRTQLYGIPSPLLNLSRRMDKGHDAEVAAFLAAVRGEAMPPIPLDELMEVSRWAIRAGHAARARS